MAERRRKFKIPLVTPEQQQKIKRKLDIKNFDVNAILRGAQLTVVGGLRALQNPALFTSEHYKQAALAVAIAIAITIVISIPIYGIRVLLWFLSCFVTISWDDDVVDSLDFISRYVLQLPFFLMTLMRYITPTLDNMFMDALAWVDYTYQQKHKDDDPSTLRGPYHDNLRKYSSRDGSTHTKSTAEALTLLVTRRVKKGGISLAIFALSYVPYIGRFVLPAASFYTFNQSVGPGPAMIIFGTGIFLPRRYLVIFLQSYFTSRSLMRELLEPYFSRIKFTAKQKRHWFHDREGLLFGFGVGFYLFLKIPFLGVLIYGIAEASTAYLITKVTDPPPLPRDSEGFAESQERWRNKHEFLNLRLANLDEHQGHVEKMDAYPLATGTGPHETGIAPSEGVGNKAGSQSIPSDLPPPYVEQPGTNPLKRSMDTSKEQRV